jgi:hypothetical protein
VQTTWLYFINQFAQLGLSRLSDYSCLVFAADITQTQFPVVSHNDAFTQIFADFITEPRCITVTG